MEIISPILSIFPALDNYEDKSSLMPVKQDSIECLIPYASGGPPWDRIPEKICIVVNSKKILFDPV